MGNREDIRSEFGECRLLHDIDGRDLLLGGELQREIGLDCSRPCAQAETQHGWPFLFGVWNEFAVGTDRHHSHVEAYGQVG